MRAPDAILEPDALDTMRSYVVAGGQAGTVVELLADSYEGSCRRRR